MSIDSIDSIDRPSKGSQSSVLSTRRKDWTSNTIDFRNRTQKPRYALCSRSNLGQEAWFATGFLTRYLIILPQRNAFVVSLGWASAIIIFAQVLFIVLLQLNNTFVLYEHSMNILWTFSIFLFHSHRCHHISVISIHLCFARDGFDGLHSLCCFLVTFGDRNLFAFAHLVLATSV